MQENSVDTPETLDAIDQPPSCASLSGKFEVEGIEDAPRRWKPIQNELDMLVESRVKRLKRYKPGYNTFQIDQVRDPFA